jgi:hypothetical protein
MVAAYTVKGDALAAEKPWVWSETRLANFGFIGNYDLAPDGKRVAALQQAQRHAVFLQNFGEVNRGGHNEIRGLGRGGPGTIYASS